MSSAAATPAPAPAAVPVGVAPPSPLGLVGPVGLAGMKGIKRSRLDDLRHKGLVPEQDCVVSGTPLWLRSRMDRWHPDKDRDVWMGGGTPDWSKVPPAGQLPALVGTREMAAMFGTSHRTPDGWRYRRVLPVEDEYVQSAHPERGTPVWRRDRILAWAAHTHPWVFDNPNAQVKLADLPHQLQEVVTTRYTATG